MPKRKDLEDRILKVVRSVEAEWGRLYELGDEYETDRMIADAVMSVVERIKKELDHDS